VLTPLQLSTQQGITVTGTVAASDPDGQTVTFVTTALSSPANGTVTIGAGGTITYQPFAAFVGVDSFTVQACDPVGACSSAVVTVTVTATPPPTTPPPTGEVKPPSPPATLPRTGSDNGAQVEWAAIASLLGLAAIAIARRPRTRPRPR
jgi:VCBS repeat-containing protein